MTTKNNRNSSTVLEARTPKWRVTWFCWQKKNRCLQGHPSSRGSWKNLFFASSSPWRLQVFHGLRLCCSNLSLHRHTTSSSSECLSKLPLPLSCKDVCDCIEGPPDSPGKMPPLQICNWITVSAKWGPFTSSRALTQISVERSFSTHNRRVKTLGSLWPTPHHHSSQDKAWYIVWWALEICWVNSLLEAMWWEVKPWARLTLERTYRWTVIF